MKKSILSAVAALSLLVKSYIRSSDNEQGKFHLVKIITYSAESALERTVEGARVFVCANYYE
jgi:hypothetical protein